MKQLKTYINETLRFSQNEYLNEWKASTSTVSSIDTKQYFVFTYKINRKSRIKIFHYGWNNFQKFRNNVYINNEHIELDSYGWTKVNYEPGTYKVHIEDLNYINNSNVINSCANMFNECWQLIEVPLFDTSYIKWMDRMFYRCSNLEKIPEFDTHNVTNMYEMFFHCTKLKDVPLLNTNSIENKYIENMFKECDNLSNETKKSWSKIYNFETHKMK